MNLKVVILLLIGLLYDLNVVNSVNVTPQSVKLAFTQTSNSMKVTWYSLNKGSSPAVIYATQPFNPTNIDGSVSGQLGSSTAYDTFEWYGYINQADMINLQQSTTYYYACGDKQTNQWSNLYNFTTSVFEDTQVTPFSVVTYGDMGIAGGNLVTLQHIQDRIHQTSFILHVGDIAYADLGKTIDDKIGGNQTIWNEFLEQITPLASTVPYMVCPGNHDIFYDLTAYRTTFVMPSEKADDAWYSFDYNGVRFVSFSTESLFIPFSPEHSWLESQFKSYRESNPNGWLVVYAHRPMYCSTVWGWCNKSDYKDLLIESVENLFYKYNVDLFIAGHSHSYERSTPMYQGVVKGTYDNPKGTVHIVVGTGGNQEGLDSGFDEPAPVWNAGIRVLEFGYGVLNAINNTHLSWQFVNDQNNTVQDSFYLTKGYFSN